MGDGVLKHNRAVNGGKAAVSTNRWFHLRKVVGYDGPREVLECGHTLWPRSDMIGEYDAARRRCKQCPKPTVPCEVCDGSGTTMGLRNVPYRCPACEGDGKWLAKVASR